MSSVPSPEIILFLYAVIVAIGIILILKLSKDKTRKISSLRLFIQVVAVIAVFMGLLIGPFNQPGSVFAPLGVSPRDHLIGANVLGNQFPDGISLPILACYFPTGELSPAPFGNCKHTFSPFGTSP